MLVEAARARALCRLWCDRFTRMLKQHLREHKLLIAQLELDPTREDSAPGIDSKLRKANVR